MSAGPGPTWWFPEGDPMGRRPVLFVPPSGAEPSVGRGLAGGAPDLAIGILQLPGRGSRSEESAPDDLPVLVQDVAAATLALPGPPPVLVGHSFGALLAYAVAGLLEDASSPAARLVAVAGASPASWSAELAADLVEFPDDDREAFAGRRAERLLTKGGADARVLTHPELGPRARDLMRIDSALAHQGFQPRPLRTPITVLVARDDELLGADACDGWAEATSGEHVRMAMAGGHFFYRDDPQALLRVLRLDLMSLDAPYGMFG